MRDPTDPLRPIDAPYADWDRGAAVDVRLGRIVEVRARATPGFMLSVAALVVGILLGVAAIITSARRRRLPDRRAAADPP